MAVSTLEVDHIARIEDERWPLGKLDFELGVTWLIWSMGTFSTNNRKTTRKMASSKSNVNLFPKIFRFEQKRPQQRTEVNTTMS